MKKTVQEIIDMIEGDKLHYDQSTQRNFIYATIDIDSEDGKISKAGNVIRSILQFDIQLPALFFWDLENGEYNIHDGKQRVLSIYHFIKPNNEITVVTRINGRETSYRGLTSDQQNKLLNYTFDIVTKKGTSEQEEVSFDLINRNAESLTEYESLRGMMHGTWIYEFEKYLDSKAKVTDKISKIGRGEQAIKFLYNCFGLLGDRNAVLKIRGYLRNIRTNTFNPKDYQMDETIELYSEFKKITSVDDEKSILVASYIISVKWDKNIITDYYRKIIRNRNDVKSWKIDTHKMAIKKLIQENIECDGQRLFTDDDKSSKYKVSQKCVELNCTKTNYNELEKDHVTPWSKGGRTILSNLQLLCKTHNASKGADEDGVKG